jgi:transcription termination factor NusB
MAKKSNLGRKDSEGQEAVVKIETLQVGMDELLKLHTAAENAATDFKEAVKAIAEKSGLNAATVSKYVKARAGDNFDATKGKVLQLALVFEEVN